MLHTQCAAPYYGFALPAVAMLRMFAVVIFLLC